MPSQERGFSPLIGRFRDRALQVARHGWVGWKDDFPRGGQRSQLQAQQCEPGGWRTRTFFGPVMIGRQYDYAGHGPLSSLQA